MHARGHPAGAGRVRGGDAATAGLRAGRLARGPQQNVAGRTRNCHVQALQGQATALPKAPAAQSSSNRPAASLALLHGGSRAWCLVIVALEPHSSALRVYDCGESTALSVRPAVLEALHLGVLSSHEGTALYLQGTVVGSAAVHFRRQCGGDAFRLVVADYMAPWLRAFSTSSWKVEGDREKFADAWRRSVEEQFPVGGTLNLRNRPVCRRCRLPPLRPLWRKQSRRQRRSRRPRRESRRMACSLP